MFRDKKIHTYFIQAPLNLEIISKIQQDLEPVIDKILQEELGVEKNEQYPTFFFKRRQAITIYYVNDMYDNGKDLLFSALEKVAQQPDPQNVTMGLKLQFFGDIKKGMIDLVITIADPDKELSGLNDQMKKAMHQANEQYQQMHQVNLYDITKSEQYPYLPHLSLGHLRTSSIKKLIKDEAKVNNIIERLKQRIIKAIAEALENLLTHENRKISIDKIGIYDLQKSVYIKEQELGSESFSQIQLPKPTGNFSVGKNYTSSHR